MGEYFFLNGEIIKAKNAFLHITDLTREEIEEIFDLAVDVKDKFKRREDYKPFRDLLKPKG